MTVETKYSVGDTVWLMKDNRAQEHTVCVIHFCCSLTLGSSLAYSLSDHSLAKHWDESELFPDKSSLLASL